MTCARLVNDAYFIGWFSGFATGVVLLGIGWWGDRREYARRAALDEER